MAIIALPYQVPQNTVATMGDDDFLTYLTETLAALPAVTAVTLGGSRAKGRHRPDSDWDLAIYYRGAFDPQSVRDIGWAGEVSEIGGWGGGLFNGGAWLRVDDRPVDLHFRDLTAVEAELERCAAGEFHVEPLVFHLAGLPSYFVVGELAIHRVLYGELPRPDFPAALRYSAPPRWRAQAEWNLGYAEHNLAPHGRLTQSAGSMALAAAQYSHAVLTARGEWTTNEKTLLDRAGLRWIDTVVAAMTDNPVDLVSAITELRDGATALIEASG